MTRSVAFARQANIMAKHGVAPPLREQWLDERTPMTAPIDPDMTLAPPPVPPSHALTPPPQGHIGKAPVGPHHDWASARG